MEYSGCTHEVKSYEEAKVWKNASCEASKYSETYKENEKKCKKDKDKPHCTMVGKCMTNTHENKNMCKFCYPPPLMCRHLWMVLSRNIYTDGQKKRYISPL